MHIFCQIGSWITNFRCENKTYHIWKHHLEHLISDLQTSHVPLSRQVLARWHPRPPPKTCPRRHPCLPNIWGLSRNSPERHQTSTWCPPGCWVFNADPNLKKNTPNSCGNLPCIESCIPFSSWWLNQPIWKSCSPNWTSFPSKEWRWKNIWNHHLVF